METLMGSSPRIRGKRHSSYDVPQELRLIPAHTGKANIDSPAYNPSEAHPRAYREYLPSGTISLVVWGSSPRIQGIHSATRHDA